MATLHFKGWKRGLKKISLERYLSEQTELSLREAYDLVIYKLMNGETFQISDIEYNRALEMAKHVEELGAIVDVVDDQDSA